MGDRSWEAALSILSNLIAFKTRAEGKGWRDAFENMHVYVQRAGLQGELDRLSVLHVAGTKGKGSTCAMTERVLRECGYRTGLYTSPHLVEVRERIRIDGGMVSREDFLQQFWDCHDRLSAAATPETGVPGYFSFLTLLAFKIFVQAKVDVVVLEVGLGGRLDATNVVNRPVACAITSLGYDHMDMLGNTLTEIAAEKAGIMKPGSPCFTCAQPDEAMASLRKVASAKGVQLTQPPLLSEYRTAGGGAPEEVLGLQGSHQAVNAALALQLAATWEAAMVASGKAQPGAAERVELLFKQRILPAQYAAGLQKVSWPGRNQIIALPEFALPAPSTRGQAEGLWQRVESWGRVAPAGEAAGAAGSDSSSSGGGGAAGGSRLTLYLDGAHTVESIETCGEWFAGLVPPPQGAAAPLGSPGQQQRAGRQLNVLVFNCTKDRTPADLLSVLASMLARRGVPISHSVFVPAESQYGYLLGSSGHSAPPSPADIDLSWQQGMVKAWRQQQQQQHGSAAAAPQLPPVPSLAGLPPQDAAGGAAVPSLQLVLAWLRRCAAEAPELRINVLVTGSLYLVGDVLRLLGRPPA